MTQTTHGLIYPDTGAAPDVPADLQALAQAIEDRYHPYTVTLRLAAAAGIADGSSYSDITGLTSITTNDDDRDVFSTATTSKVVVKQAGVYDADAVLGIVANGTGNRAASISVNGTSVASTIGPGFAGNSSVQALFKGGLILPANAVVALQGWQTSGGTLNTVAGTTYLTLTRRWSQ